MAGLATTIVAAYMVGARRLYDAFSSTGRDACLAELSAVGGHAVGVHGVIRSALHAQARHAEPQPSEKGVERRAPQTPHRDECGEEAEESAGGRDAAVHGDQ